MKKILTVLVCLLSVLSFNVYAAQKEKLPTVVEGKEPVKVYIFTKDQCPFCEKAKTYINGLKETYGKYFEVVIYEVYDSSWKVENAHYETLMHTIGKKHDRDVSGVPYIVIGEEFDANEWDEKTTGDNVKAAILKEYVNEEYKDIVAPALAEIESAPDPHANDGIVICIIGIVVIAVVGAVIYAGRKDR